MIRGIPVDSSPEVPELMIHVPHLASIQQSTCSNRFRNGEKYRWVADSTNCNQFSSLFPLLEQHLHLGIWKTRVREDQIRRSFFLP